MDAIFLKPQTIAESAEVLDCMSAGKTVMLSFEDLDRVSSGRMLDMVTGAAYVLKGRICRVSAEAVMIVPNGTDVEMDSIDQ